MQTNMSLPDLLSKLKNIPTLPHILVRLLKICDEDNGSLSELTSVIEKDPAITAQILKLVNSAYYSRNIRIGNLKGAVGFLGTNAIKNIAICSSVHEVFKKVGSKSNFNLKKFWWHSLRCATIARIIAKNRNFHDPDEAFLSGMLHDIGKIILWLNFSENYLATAIEFSEKEDGNHDPFHEIEARTGFNHAEIGALILDKWNFQSLIADSVRYHHHPFNQIINALPLVKLIYAADALSNYPGHKPKECMEVARELFGLTKSAIEELLNVADEELKIVAESLNISVEPVRLKEFPASEVDTQVQNKLTEDVRDHSLLIGTLQNLLGASDEQEILRISHQGMQILFDVSMILFFIYDNEKNVLRGIALDDEKNFSMIKDVIIPLDMEKSLLVECLQSGSIQNTFARPENSVKIILDEQITRLLEKDGLICVPMIVYGEKTGVIVIGLNRAEFSNVEGKMKILKMFADQSAVALRVHHLRRSQFKKIQAERIDATLSLANKIVHEVNNPLSIIKNYLKVLELKLAKIGLANNEIKILNEEINRVAIILRKLTSPSENWIGKVEAVDLNQLLSDISIITRESLLKQYKVQLHIDFDPRLPPIMSDKNSMKQVFINLMKNSFEALTGGGNIYIQTRYVSNLLENNSNCKNHKAKGFVEVTIRDDGPGISDEIKNRLFEPHATTKDKSHSGLGLSIVYTIIKGLNGTISYESEQSKGTTFRIELPVSGNIDGFAKSRHTC